MHKLHLINISKVVQWHWILKEKENIEEDVISKKRKQAD